MPAETPDITTVRRLAFVVNPAAGHGRGLRLAERLAAEAKACGAVVSWRLTAGAGDATALAAMAVAEGADAVVACGGDGTANEVVQALAGGGTRMAVARGGRGNDLARALDVPSDPARWARMVVRGYSRRMDLGLAGSRHFATVATLGFDAAVSARAARGLAGLRGKAAYVAAAVLTLASFRPPRVEVRGVGRSYEGNILLVATANTGMYGGGMRIAPGARADDGLFRVCLIREVSRLAVLRLMPLVILGRHADHPCVQLWDTPYLEIRADPPCEVYADGEPIGCTPLRLDVASQAIRMIVPLDPAAPHPAGGTPPRAADPTEDGPGPHRASAWSGGRGRPPEAD